MARSRQLVESATCVGALLGLVIALDSPGASGPCGRGAVECAAVSAVAIARPYVVHAAVGAGAGLVAALLLLLARRSYGPVAAPAAPRREAIPERVRHEVWRRDRGRCVDCGSRTRLEFDHIIPVSRGGSGTARNIELRCESCNRSKGARV